METRRKNLTLERVKMFVEERNEELKRIGSTIKQVCYHFATK